MIIFTLTCLYNMVFFTLTCLYNMVFFTLTCLYNMVFFSKFDNCDAVIIVSVTDIVKTQLFVFAINLGHFLKC